MTMAILARQVVDAWIEQGATAQEIQAGMAAGNLPTQQDVEYVEQRRGARLTPSQLGDLETAMAEYVRSIGDV